MKTNKLAYAIAAGVLLDASAQAQVTINISGAVAFRDTSYRAIRSIYGANLTSQNPADGPGTPNQLKVTWTGTIPSIYGGQTVTVKAFYNGANAGIQDLVQNRNVNYLALATPGDTNTVNELSDIAYSSVFQNSTAFTTPALTSTEFGVTPVFFVKSTSAPAGLVNITRNQFRVLAKNGSVPGWFLTGNPADTADIYYISRDPSAGQRTIVEKENAFTGAIQSYLWNTNTSSFEFDPTGRTSTQIRDTLNISGPAVSYLTGVDAINVNGGTNILAHNGYKAFTGQYSTNSPATTTHTPVINGQYTQWGYEHIFTRQTASPNVVAFRTNLIAKILVDLSTSAFSLPKTAVNVGRLGQSGEVSP